MDKLKIILKNSFKKFKSSQSYQSLKNITLLRNIKLASGQIIWKLFPAKYRFHDDPIFQSIFKLVGKEINATSIVETGTFLGYSTSLMAEQFPKLPIFTTEINKTNFKKATSFLSKFKNISLYNQTSTKFLEFLIKEKKLGKNPLFFLDAHWLDHWPIEEELKIITKKLKSAVIVIDDFKVPGNDNFKYDHYKNKVCSLELITSQMNKKNKYALLLPNYSLKDLKKNKFYPDLTGYPIIFQNMPQQFKRFSSLPFVKKFFVDRSDLIDRL